MGLRDWFRDVRGEGLPAAARAPYVVGESWNYPARTNRLTRSALDEAAEAATQERAALTQSFAGGVEAARTFGGDEQGNVAQLGQLERDFKLGNALAMNANPQVAARGQEMMRKAYEGLNPHLEDIETRAETLSDRLDTQEFGLFSKDRDAMQGTLKDAQARILAEDDRYNKFASQMEQFKTGSALSETAIAEYLGTSIEEAGGFNGSLELLGMLGGAVAVKGPGGARLGRAAGALLERMASGEKLSNTEALSLASALLGARKLANERVIGETSERLQKHDAYGIERGWLRRSSFRTDQYELTPEEQRLRNTARPNRTQGAPAADGAPEMPTTGEGLEAQAAALPKLEAEGNRAQYSITELTNTPATQLPERVQRMLAITTAERGELRYRPGEGNEVGTVVDGKGAVVDLPKGVLAIIADRMRKQRTRARDIAEDVRTNVQLGQRLTTPPQGGGF